MIVSTLTVFLWYFLGFLADNFLWLRYGIGQTIKVLALWFLLSSSFFLSFFLFFLA